MKSIQKIGNRLLAAVFACAMLLCAGCSTPENAMTVDGTDYSTGEYLANLYNNYYNIYYNSGLYQYAQYGMDPWEQTMNYGEGDTAISMKLADYLVQITKDGIVRQKAVKNLMAKYNVPIDEEALKTFNESMSDYRESDMLRYGFNKEHYKNMYIAANIEEQSLFYGLYDEGGEREIPKEDIRKFFDDNYVAFKAISITLTDSEGNEMSDADKKAQKDKLNTYLEQYKKSGDFSAVIAQYNADKEAEEEAEDPDSAGAGTTSSTSTTATSSTSTTTASASATNTTAASASASATDETTATANQDSSASTTTTGSSDENDEEEEEEEEKDPDLQMVNSVEGDKAVVEAVQKIPENTAQVIEYTPTNGSPTAALVLRLNVEEQGGEGYYEDEHEHCIYGLKFEEFDKEVQETADALTVTFNDRAISMCDPKNFEKVDTQE